MALVGNSGPGQEAVDGILAIVECAGGPAPILPVPWPQRAYGLILTQGYGSIGKHAVETPALIRYGQMTSDELFVSADAAAGGVVIANRSATENLVLLKHFGPGNPQAPVARVQ